MIGLDALKKSDSWNDWKWQFSHRIRNVEKLSEYLPLSDTEKENILTCLSRFRMAITPYYLSLIDRSDPDDPIKRQCVPSICETYPCVNDMDDPLGEVTDSPVPHIVHRYPDRVLLLVTLQCSMYCRHCTRRRIVGEEDRAITGKGFENALAYIRRHTEIRDVLISGGDPLTLSDEKLEHIISKLREIPHVDIIRIGTRVPAVMPMRITPELTAMLRKYHPIWMNTHFNHPGEITPDSIRACEMIVDAGIPLGNQMVLLRGINDNFETVRELMLKLVHMRVRPYYIYQCDLSTGISHFRTPVQTGVDIIHKLTGNISGFAVPKFVIDAPGGGGKIPVAYDYVRGQDDAGILLENYEGKTYRYPDKEPLHLYCTDLTTDLE